jgi:hypothetical protein
MSMVCKSAWPLEVAESDPVKVRTMMRPKRTSEERSVGSRNRRRASFAAGVAGSDGGPAPPASIYSSSFVTVQPSSGLKILIEGPIVSVSGPRSFWYTTPSLLTMKVWTPVTP